VNRAWGKVPRGMRGRQQRRRPGAPLGAEISQVDAYPTSRRRAFTVDRRRCRHECGGQRPTEWQPEHRPAILHAWCAHLPRAPRGQSWHLRAQSPRSRYDALIDLDRTRSW